MSRTTSPSTGRPYGLARVARIWRVSRVTVYRHRADRPAPTPRRRGPCPDAELVEHIRQGVPRHFGAIGPGVAAGLKPRHDHGSNHMSGDFQAEIECPGITSSPSFLRGPEGDGVTERFIRTLKENFLWIHTFDTVEEPRCAPLEFAHHPNETWLVPRHGHRAPAQALDGLLRVDQPSITKLPSAAWVSPDGGLKSGPRFMTPPPTSAC